MELGIKNKHALIDLARHGTLARKHIHPDLLIGNYPVGKNVFREGDILDANGVLNLILTNNGTGSGAGEKGEPGITPHIGDNGNWFIGDVDTGVKSEGRDGISPIIRINSETFEWEISNDGGTTYVPTGVIAKGIQGEQGPLGLLGERGPKGETGERGLLGPQGVLGPTGNTGPLGIQGPLGLQGIPGRGISSIIQTTTSKDNAGLNTITITFDDGTTTDFTVLNGDIDISNTYRKEQVDALIRSVQGHISSTNGPMTVVSQETENGNVYIAYRSMDALTASTVTNISFTWTDVDGDIIYGNNLQYYKRVIFGSETLANVWCTPILLVEPISVNCTVLYYDSSRSPIMDYAYDHAFMKQTEYDSLSIKDPNTIYFIWDAELNTGGGFPYEFPIVLDGGDAQNSISVFPAIFPITLA